VTADRPLRVLLLHGPNLNLLGTREPEVYGSLSLDEIEELVRARAAELGVELRSLQSNHEGELVDAVQAAAKDTDGIVINPGGYSHTSVAIRDAIASAGVPTVVAHLSNPPAREEFRHLDVVASACIGSVAGFGWRSYALALDALVGHLRGV